MEKCHTSAVLRKKIYKQLKISITCRLVYNVYAQITGSTFHKLTKSYHYHHTTILTIYKMKKCKVIRSIIQRLIDKKFLILKGNRPTHCVKKQLEPSRETPNSCLKEASWWWCFHTSAILKDKTTSDSHYTHTLPMDMVFPIWKSQQLPKKLTCHPIFENMSSLWGIDISLSERFDTEYQDKAHIALWKVSVYFPTLCHKFLPFTCNMTS